MKKENQSKGFSLKDRFQYWFDNKMTKGSLNFIRVLIVASLLLALLIAGLIILFGFNEEGETASVFWNSISTVINAWMPYFDEGSVGYVILMSITAIAGLLFTSVLIGIVTSAIEEKIGSLKKGNSLVLERDHIVLLGFCPGEYSLLNQLILAAAGRPACVVIAEDMEREEMEQSIEENLDAPKNFRIVCRTVDITDPASLEKCSIETCRTVIVSPADDLRTIKAILAVSALLEDLDAPQISVSAVISNEGYLFPASLAQANNISTLRTNTIIAKMIAHSCTQTGLSETFREVFDFEGCEFYPAHLDGIGKMKFGELAIRLDGAVPAGIFRDGKVTLNPPADFLLGESDRILLFSEESDTEKIALTAPSDVKNVCAENSGETDKEEAETVIFGQNETLPVILRELPENVVNVRLVGAITEEKKSELEPIAAKKGLKLKFFDGDTRSDEALCGLSKNAKHIVVLNDHEKDPEEADMEAIFLLINLRDIRRRNGSDFNITVELRKEHNHKLAGCRDHTDFLVSSSMSSLILAQVAENPALIDVFRELLSNDGNELYLKNAAQMKLTGSHSVRDLRSAMLEKGYIMLGILNAEKISRYNPPLDETVSLSPDDDLIVLGRS
ncbi:MAG: hypothetical protein IJV00_03165 [Clostridia bacterium]|nr:hypothetical protein [Clostridia bacterium]